MGPKKKKGGKRGKKGKKGKQKQAMTLVDRTFYELTITDLNNKLARLRSHVAKLEGSHEEMAEKLRQFEEDRADVTAHLQSELTEKLSIIREMEERLLELQNMRDEENRINQEIIRDWQNKYEAMEEQLTSEIKLLNAKLKALEEFHLQRSSLLMKFDEQEAEMRERLRAQQEKIYAMEQKAIFERDQLKKDVEAKLLQLSDDFTKSSETRIAGYTRRLIRENISLNKEMDRMVQSQLRMEEENKKIKEGFLEMKGKLTCSADMKERLIRTCQNQIEIIENLTRQCEALINKYHEFRHFKKLYETSLKSDVCDKFIYNEMTKKLHIMEQRVEKLKVDKQKLISLHEQHELEVIRLQDIFKQIKFTVQSAIRGELDDTDDPEFRADQRKNLLTEIMNILAPYSDEITTKPSVDTISDSGALLKLKITEIKPRRKASLYDIFVHEARKAAASELYVPKIRPKPYDGRITPQERSLESETLVDVQTGSTIIFSSSTEGDESPPEEEGDYGSSSSAEQKKAPEADQKKPKKKPKVEDKGKAKEKVKAEDKPKVSGGEEVSVESERKETEEEEEEEDEYGAEMVSKISLGQEEQVAKSASAIRESDIEAESAAIFEAMTEADEEENDAGYFFY